MSECPPWQSSAKPAAQLIRQRRADRHTLPVSDVQLLVGEVATGFDEPSLVPPRVAPRSEEVRPHVVVYADDLKTEGIEVPDDLRADEAAGASNK